MLLGWVPGALAATATNQVKFQYAAPKHPDHMEILDLLKERRTLERLQEFLSPFKLPRPLSIVLAACDGEADAFYDKDVITICYEYVDLLLRNKPNETTPGGVTPLDAVSGPLVDTCLHEFAHALIDMFTLPVFGRMEDAADLIGAYIYLQLSLEEARRLIRGTAYAFLSEAAGKQQLNESEFADEHSLPQQRAYNVLCMAYGADKDYFGDFESLGYLPTKRAVVCEEEYEQIQDAYEELIGPHIDQELARKIFKNPLLIGEALPDSPP
jgi:hypothetical protein